MCQVHRRSAERLRAMCCVNGGCFIKVGQHVGALEYLLPKEYVEVMRVLHSDAPQTPVEELYKVIKEDLGQEVCSHIQCVNFTHLCNQTSNSQASRKVMGRVFERKSSGIFMTYLPKLLNISI